MRNTFTRNEIALAVACALTLSIFPEIALAQARDMNEHSLLLDSRGAPVTSQFGLCWHTGFGPAPHWTRGCHAEVAARVAQYVAPAAVAPVAMPGSAPVVLAAAAALPSYEKVAFDANILFDSDKATLRPAGRDTLDRFIADIHGLEAESIVAIGYADRMGSHDSNQALSGWRVDAVKAYLVGKGIKADRVQTSARGETRPSTFAADCKDANNAKNVACMQPDRHVFIEVSGTRMAK